MDSNKEKNIVLRVTQLDAANIDNQVFQILQSELKSSFESETLSSILYVEPELNAILRYILWKFSIMETGVTIGQTMFNTEYLSSNKSITSKQRYVYGIVAVIIPWVKERSSSIIKAVNSVLQLNNSCIHVQYIEKFCKYTENSLKLFSLINFLLFLKYGKHVNILQRTLKLDHVFSGKAIPRYIDYAYMRKEMVWESVSQTLICILPLLNVRKLTNNIFKVYKIFIGYETLLNTNIKFACQICCEKATNPYSGGCEHIFCYYCIKSNLLVDSAYSCPACGELINEIDPSMHRI